MAKKKKAELPKLKPQHLKFINSYINNNFKGVHAYAEAYDKDIEDPNQYNYCKTAAHLLLQREDICNYIHSKLEENHLNVNEALQILRFLAVQKGELPTALGAVKTVLQLNEKLIEKTEIKIEYKANFG
tara:strand:+ start:547 stop:933 length:387 start_codon:yes stop_codon:yes gene_type:complete